MLRRIVSFKREKLESSSFGWLTWNITLVTQCMKTVAILEVCVKCYARENEQYLIVENLFK
jgi:hypothetical protein